MENSPGILFWVLAIISVASSVVAVTAGRAIYLAGALVITILAVLNLLLVLGIGSLAIIFGINSLILLALFYPALRNSPGFHWREFKIESHSKQIFYFIIAALFFVGVLFLISETDVWQYASEIKLFSFGQLLAVLGERYLLPFLLIKVFLLLFLLVIYFNFKRRAA